jgi:hypothetical protein
MKTIKYSKRDIRNNFPNIEKNLTSLYSSGSVELNAERYITGNDLNSQEKFRNYSFIS